jgi:FkbM family methyltransferase
VPGRDLANGGKIDENREHLGRGGPVNLFQRSTMLRSSAWRLGRKLYALARGEGRNDPRTNGEYWLQALAMEHGGPAILLMDVGANKGDWTLHALKDAITERNIRIHAFEPSSGTRQILARRCGRFANVTAHSQALSHRQGEGDFYSKGAGEGTNSLNPTSGSDVERVELTTCDDFLRENEIDHVTMIKIDTEGFDLMVMRGAARSLSEGRIDAVQFEYNWRWLLNNACLRDVFLLIADKPYRLGKLVGEAIEFHDEWHFELDRFFENNYVLVRKGSVIERYGRVMRFDRSNVIARAVDP